MEKNAIHFHKYSSVQILFIKTSSFFNLKLVTLTMLVFFQAHFFCLPLSPLTPQPSTATLRPWRGLEIDEFPYLKRWPVKLEIYIADLEWRGTVYIVPWAIDGHRPTHHTAHL